MKLSKLFYLNTKLIMIENQNTDDSSYNLKNSLENKRRTKYGKNSEEKNNIKLLKIIADVLNQICKENKTNKEDKLIITIPFTVKTIPSITIYNFIQRLSKYSQVSDETFILTLIYIDKICHFYKINLNYYNIHKLFLASFITSIKYHEDEMYSIKLYAKIGGVPHKELIHLEYEFMKLIQFNLFVNEDLFNKYKSNLINFEEDY